MKLKKQLLTFAVGMFVAGSAAAEGYQVNTLSAKQNGMGHTGTALKLGAESQIYNPAGMAWLKENMQVSASVAPIFSYVTATLPDGTQCKTDNKASTPMSVNAAFNIYDNFKAGISFYTPYGSGINWTDNWPGAVLNQSVKLQMFTVQPTLAYRPIKNLSIGAGLMITWGKVNLHKGLVTPQSYDALVTLLKTIGQLPAETPLSGGATPASVALEGNAHPKLGVNVGVMYDINSQWTVGANFRSEMVMEVKSGEASLNYANKATEMVLESSIGALNHAEFKAAMPACAIWNLGVSYKPIENLVIAADLQFTHWKAYEALDMQFAGIPDEGPGMPSNRFDQYIVKNYHNSFTYHLGAQYSLTPRLDLRAGLMIDTTPCDKDNYNPETPGMTKIEPSVGLSFRPVKNLSIDLAFLYVAGCGAKNRTGHYEDFIATKYNDVLSKLGPMASAMGLAPLEENASFTADYKLHAFSPAIGLTFSF